MAIGADKFLLLLADKGEAGGSPYLDGVVDSVVMDLDATQTDSYSGTGQTWANLIESPADGAAQTDYDFWLGSDATTTGDPVFTGTAGDSAAYFLYEGGDFHRAVQGIASQPTLAKASRTTGGSAIWLAVGFRTAATLNNTSPTFSTAKNLFDSTGFEIFTTSAGNFIFRRDSINGVLGTLLPSTNYMYIISWNENNTNENLRVWLNQTTATDNAFTFSTVTADADVINAGIAIRSNGDTIDNGARIYSVAAGNEYLDDTKAAAIIEHLEARHARSYTP